MVAALMVLLVATIGAPAVAGVSVMSHVGQRQPPPDDIASDTNFGQCTLLKSKDNRTVVLAGAPETVPARETAPSWTYECPNETCVKINDDESMFPRTANQGDGSTMAWSSLGGGAYAVCAPRYQEKKNNDVWRTFGRCVYDGTFFTVDTYESANVSAANLNPLFGFAAHFDATGVLWVGAPWVGATSEMGTVARLNSSETTDFIQWWRTDFLGKNESTRLFGTAITSGRFVTQALPGEVMLAISTRRTNGSEEIHFYAPKDFHGKPRPEHTPPLHIVAGPQPFSQFGYAVTATDFDGDGLDELVVAAPAYKTGHLAHDDGAVYVFARCSDSWMCQRTRLLGDSRGSMFGMTVAAVGDLDGDSYNDLAVGSPNEEKVYIFTGDATDLLSQDRVQRIFRSDAPLGIQPDHKPALFGFSISNSLKSASTNSIELAIGAPAIDKVYLMRSYPPLRLVVELDPVDSLNITDTILPLTVRYRYEPIGGGQLTAVNGVNVSVLISVRSHHILDNVTDSTGNTTEPRPKRHFATIAANLSATLEQQTLTANFMLLFVPKFQPFARINVLLDWMGQENVQTEATSGECTHCYALKKTRDHVTREVDFNTGCKEAVCVVDLLVKCDPTGDDILAGIVKGRTQNIAIDVTVSNAATAEYAYSVQLTATPSAGMMLVTGDTVHLKHSRDEQGRVVSHYAIGDPVPRLAAGENCTYRLHVDTSVLAALDRSIQSLRLNVSARSEGRQKLAGANRDAVLLDIPLRSFSSVEVTGYTVPREIMREDKREFCEVTAKFVITNHGPSVLDGIQIGVAVPMFTKKKTRFVEDFKVDFKPNMGFLRIDKARLSATQVLRNDTIKPCEGADQPDCRTKYFETAEKLTYSPRLEITVLMRLRLPELLKFINGTSYNTFEFRPTVQFFRSRNETALFGTHALLIVKNWPSKLNVRSIAVASTISVVVLMGLGWALKHRGFFKRPMKEKMETIRSRRVSQQSAVVDASTAQPSVRKMSKQRSVESASVTFAMDEEPCHDAAV